MPIQNEYVRSAWDGVREGLGLILAIAIFLLVRLICKWLGIEEDVVGAFGALTMLASAGIGFAIIIGVERLLFGREVEGRLAPWLKIVLFVGLTAAVVLAIWGGVDAYRGNHAAAPMPQLAAPADTTADAMRQLEQVRERMATTRRAATTKGQ
jgi:hypothetical protein